ncbi:MAG: peptidoglycan-binding protein, partial [Ruminiclostridium sp.]|nr:peptidoglycan-binding protein [Ruminiclostridium sp.]
MIKIAYSTISYGSSGSDVKKLQQALNDKGYTLQVDGQFGANTQAAVKDYQKKNGLQVD